MPYRTPAEPPPDADEPLPSEVAFLLRTLEMDRKASWPGQKPGGELVFAVLLLTAAMLVLGAVDAGVGAVLQLLLFVAPAIVLVGAVKALRLI